MKLLPDFWKRFNFRYKLTVYFVLFGLSIGYISFIVYTHIVIKQTRMIIGDVFSQWLAVGTAKQDRITEFIGKSYTYGVYTSYPFLKLINNNIISKFSIQQDAIYYRDSADGRWYALFSRMDGIMDKFPVDNAGEINILKNAMDKKIYSSIPVYYGKTDRIYFWIDLTRPYDANRYIIKIYADRNGFLKYFGRYYIIPVYTAIILLASLLISGRIGFRISRPISRLNLQAMEIASGNLDHRTDISSNDEIGELSRSVNIMADSIKKYIREIHEKMDTISVMSKIDKAVLSSISRYDLVDRVTFFAAELFPDCTISLAITDMQEHQYHILSQYIRGIRTETRNMQPIYFTEIGETYILRNRGTYTLNYRIHKDQIAYVNRLTNENYLHLLNVPLYIDEEYTGSLFAGKFLDEPFTEYEMQTFASLGNQIGVAMKNVRYLEEKEKLYLGILLALSKAIDAKSKWTAGHSERVALYSEKIGRKLGMNEQEIRNISISAILHDIGKIAIPETILDKPGELSQEEFEVITKHPEIGAAIVENIPGSKNFIEGILFHHESWNGAGYPSHLEKEKIPLQGRIIAMADVYDSVSADRPYRPGMNRDEVRLLIYKEKGGRLDPFLADIMLEIMDEEFNTYPA